MNQQTEIQTAIDLMGSVEEAQRVIRLRYSNDEVEMGFSGDGINLFGFRQFKVSDKGMAELNGERNPYNADKTHYIRDEARFQKAGLYKVNIHDAQTHEKVNDLDVYRQGTHYWWHPTDSNLLIWAEGNQMKAVDIATEDITILATFSQPTEAGNKAAGGDGNEPDSEGNILLGDKDVGLYVYNLFKNKVVWENNEMDPADDFPTTKHDNLDYAQAFGKWVILNIKGTNSGLWLADQRLNILKEIYRRSTHMELGFWEGKPAVYVGRINDKDAEYHDKESKRGYVVSWDEENDLEMTWHPTDLWPHSRMGGHTGGQHSWTEAGLFTALHSCQKYDIPYVARCNEVFQHLPGRARRLTRHGINSTYTVARQPEVRGTFFKGQDGWYFIEVPPADPWENIQHFLETGEEQTHTPSPIDLLGKKIEELEATIIQLNDELTKSQSEVQELQEESNAQKIILNSIHQLSATG